MLETAWESRWLPVQKKQQKADDKKLVFTSDQRIKEILFSNGDKTVKKQ